MRPMEPAPPPVVQPKPPAPPPEPPDLAFWNKIDWNDSKNQLMLVLGLGSVIITKVIFRKMQE